MNVGQLFEKLSFGELSNLTIGMEGAGSIRESDQPKLINYLNEGLKVLHSRFLLMEKDLVLVLRDEVTEYYLREQYAVCSEKPAPYKYIEDTPSHLFKGDVVKVIEVRDEIGLSLHMNHPAQWCGIYTPQFDLLQVKWPSQHRVLEVIYQATHPILSATDLETNIEIPFFFEEALQAFVASKVFSHMNGQEHLVRGQDHMNRFEAFCVEAESLDLVSKGRENIVNTFSQKGWV